jgi:hypothetical protein
MLRHKWLGTVIDIGSYFAIEKSFEGYPWWNE